MRPQSFYHIMWLQLNETNKGLGERGSGNSWFCCLGENEYVTQRFQTVGPSGLGCQGL